MTERRADSYSDLRRACSWLAGAVFVSAAICFSTRVQAAATLAEAVASEIFGEAALAENVVAVRQQAATLSDAERFAFLTDWVLPGPSHQTYRLSGEFSQLRPLSSTGQPAAGTVATEDQYGGKIVSPVFDLLDLAARTGRSQELLDQVISLPERKDEYSKRSQAALLVLLHLELQDFKAADAAMGQLHAIVASDTPTEMHDQWPETLVAYRCVKRFPDFEPISDLLGTLVSRRLRKGTPAVVPAWFVQMWSLTRESEYHRLSRWKEVVTPTPSNQKSLKNWIPFAKERASTCGRGFPKASWLWDGEQCQHLTGHDDDYLIYRSPLRGNYSVEADFRGVNTTQILAAGALFGPHAPQNMITGTFQSGAIVQPVDPPFHRTDQWIRCRSDIRDGVSRTWLNGRLVDTHTLPTEYDPWLAIRSWSRTPGAVRDVRISGSPKIPASVTISDKGCLSGWWGYHDERVGSENAQWLTPEDSPDGAQIIGIRRGLPGWSLESLLRYHRPLIEDGWIDYEFFYSPGKMHTHPALGRLAFLLDGNGVRLHWITDGRFDRSSLRPDDTFPAFNAENEFRPLPLKTDAWNAMRVSLKGQTVLLELNGDQILERELEATNSRHFGLFHYSEQTEVRVRNVVMQGNWPRALSPVSEQQLADPTARSFDDELTKMSPVFSHDFGQDGLPDEYFDFAGGFNMSTTAETPAGLVHSQRSDGAYRHSSFNSWMRMQGDFDVTADFTELDVTENQVCGCEMYVTFEGGLGVGVKRRWQQPDLHRLVVDWALPAEPGTATAEAGEVRRTYDFISTEALGGRLRVARRGDTAHVMFAENDSSEFRVVASRSFKTMGQREAHIRLTAVANKGGSTRVTWKRLRIAADRLLVIPDPRNPPKILLYVMNSDGSNLRAITEPMDDPDIHGHASPDWSPDGRLIAFDGYTGRAENSHSYLIKPDGTDLKDLGIGIMPTFSPDGKRLAFTWALNGMATMNLEGEDRQVITPEGWAVQWSPNGKWVSYESRGRVNGRYAANLTVINLKTKEKRLLLEGDHATRYSRIYWNADWSPDSKQIAFKGTKSGGEAEVAVTAVAGSSNGFRVLTTEATDPDMSWHPDGKSLLFAMNSKAHSGKRLFVFDLETSELSLLETQPMDQINFQGVWSPDGKQLAFSSRELPGPIPWKPKTPAE